jgi:septum site-determining protein MinC
MDVLSRDGAFADSNVAAFTRSRAAFDLKGVMASLTVLRLRSRDLNLIERQLRAKVTQFPQFFQSAPVVLDLSELEGGVDGFPLAALVRALAVCRVVPVAVTNVEERHRQVAMSAGLGVVNLSAARPAGDPEAAVDPGQARPEGARILPPRDPASGPRDVTMVDRTMLERAERERAEAAAARNTPTPSPRQTPPQGMPIVAALNPTAPPSASAAASTASAPGARPAAPAPGAHRAPMVVRQPVRSGQLVYAEKNDLIVLAPVNPGAQIIADGNIHIYSTLRGRAVAGAQGYGDARIFCQKFEPELIAIAGSHLTFDDIPKDSRGRPVQVFLQNGTCTIAPL